MRPLHVIAQMGAGGAESLVVELVRQGAARGWAGAVASAGGARADALAAAGVPTYDVPCEGRYQGLAHALIAIRRAIIAHRADVIVAHNIRATALVSLAARSVRPRPGVVSVFHGVADADYRNAARVLSHGPDVVVMVSESIRDRMLEAGFAHDHCLVIRNAISAPQLPSRTSARMDLGLPEVPVALCLARMVPQKRHDVLLEAWARVPEPALLLLAGDGPLRPALESRSVELGLAERVRFLGVRDDVAALLSAADLTCLASDWEGLPIAVLESMAAGRPVVATDVDGVAEAVGTDAGRLVPPRDPAALAAALAELLYDVPARQVAAAAARRRIETAYHPEPMTDAYEEAMTIASGRVRDRVPGRTSS